MEPYEDRDIRNMPGEIWRPAFEFEDLYEVSNEGRVKSLQKDIIMKQSLNKGSLQIQLSKVMVQVSRLVYLSFSPCDAKEVEGLFVMHRNKVRTDNRLENLEPATPAESKALDSKLGRYSVNIKASKKGAMARAKSMQSRKEKMCSICKKFSPVAEFPKGRSQHHYCINKARKAKKQKQ